MSEHLYNCFPPYGGNVTFEYDAVAEIMVISSRIVRGRLTQVADVRLNVERVCSGTYLTYLYITNYKRMRCIVKILTSFVLT